eukprot:gene1058-biopygen473
MQVPDGIPPAHFLPRDLRRQGDRAGRGAWRAKKHSGRCWPRHTGGGTLGGVGGLCRSTAGFTARRPPCRLPHAPLAQPIPTIMMGYGIIAGVDWRGGAAPVSQRGAATEARRIGRPNSSYASAPAASAPSYMPGYMSRSMPWLGRGGRSAPERVRQT